MLHVVRESFLEIFNQGQTHRYPSPTNPPGRAFSWMLHGPQRAWHRTTERALLLSAPAVFCSSLGELVQVQRELGAG